MVAGAGGMRLRPMWIGDILDETFRLWRRHFLSFLVAMAIVQVPIAVLSALSTILGPAAPARPDQLVQYFLTTGPLLALVTLISGLGSLLGHGAIVQLASAAILGRPTVVDVAYRTALGRSGALLWTVILLFLCLGLMAVTLIGIPFAIYFSLGWIISTQAVVLEQARGRGAMRRSTALVDGHRWRVFLLLLLIGLLVFILSVVPSGLVGAAAGVIDSLTGGAAGRHIATQIATPFTQAAAQSILGPLYWIATTVLYYELRVRKEGFDLEQLAASSGKRQAGPSP